MVTSIDKIKNGDNVALCVSIGNNERIWYYGFVRNVVKDSIYNSEIHVEKIYVHDIITDEDIDISTGDIILCYVKKEKEMQLYDKDRKNKC